MRVFLTGLLLLTACGDDAMPADDAAIPCSSNEDCDDGLFCTGTEVCAPEASGADARGCVASALPCLAVQRCVEETEACEALCEVAADADGDGVDAIECGGTDCDDADPNRFPGNPEACNDVDEDCDPSTFGSEDRDADGYVDGACCNGDTCGRDCDDTRAGVSPEATEACNLRDDDCDGTIDEEVLLTFYRDADGDLFGTEEETLMDCSAPPGFVSSAGDCDDDNAMRNPGLVEICDGLDNDCNDLFDAAGEDDDEDGFVSLACGGTDCRDDQPTVNPDATETCDGFDTDCDGSLERSVEDVDGDGAPSCGPGPLDCIDTESRTGVCEAPLGCHSPVCACEIVLPFDWGGVDLDSGRVFGPVALGDTSGIDVGTDPGGAIGALTVSNGARHQLAAGLDWWGATSATMLGSMGTSITMRAGEIYLVESNRGFLYRVGFAEARSGGARFVYAPVLDAPASFSCP